MVTNRPGPLSLSSRRAPNAPRSTSMAARSEGTIVPGWLTTVIALRAIATEPIGANSARFALICGWIDCTVKPYVLPPIVGASSSGRSPVAFASVRDGWYGCAPAGGGPGGGGGAVGGGVVSGGRGARGG